MNQLTELSKHLPTGDKGRSIQSPRTNILMQYEHNRRQYNRINGESLDLYTFIHMIGNPLKVGGMRFVNCNGLNRVKVFIRSNSKAYNYKRSGKYKNNKRIK